MKWEATSGWRRVMKVQAAFTLIEIMVVVAIMGVILAMGLPPMIETMHPDPLRKAAADLCDVCKSAREKAIFTGTIAQIIFHPLAKQFQLEGAASGKNLEGVSGQLPDDVKIQVLDVNLKKYEDKEEVKVRFFPNGTSDDMTVVFINDKNVQRSVSLEITTALADIETGDMTKLISK